MKGIDVSHHQGRIDWAKAAADGVCFAIIRAGLGRYARQQDTCFVSNMKGAKAAGLPLGIYWYSYAVSAAEAEQEAAACLQVIAPYRDSITLPVFFDQEYEPGILALDNRRRTDICLAFMKKIEESGYRAGLYCSLDWWQSRLEAGRMKEYPLWIAQYAKACSCRAENLILWQYSGTGSVAGISGKVDLDEGYDGLFPPRDGWTQTGGSWFYRREEKLLTSQWIQDGGHWYYLGEDGRMLTGLVQIEGKRYMLNPERRDSVPKGALIVTDERGEVKM